jgi:nicotinamidase-related amidase
MADFQVDTSKMALVNVDMQNTFVENTPIAAPGGREVLTRINGLVEVCREAGIQIIHASHVLRPDESNVGVMAEIMPRKLYSLIKKDRESSELHKDLNVAPNDILLDKPRFGAFHSTDLEILLRSKGIDTIIVTGIATNICCETTAREANVRDFKVFFLSDGTETFPIGEISAEEIQRVTCATLGMAFAQVLTVDEMIEKIRRVAAATDAA